MQRSLARALHRLATDPGRQVAGLPGACLRLVGQSSHALSRQRHLPLPGLARSALARVGQWLRAEAPTPAAAPAAAAPIAAAPVARPRTRKVAVRVTSGKGERRAKTCSERSAAPAAEPKRRAPTSRRRPSQPPAPEA